MKKTEYWIHERGEGDIVFNNVEITDKENKIEKAYKEVEDRLGITAVELFYIPQEMTFEYSVCGEDRVILEFTYGNNYFHFYQVHWNLESSTNYKSDRKSYKEIYNRYLDSNIVIYKNELEGENPEFGAQFLNGDAIYYLYGIIDEEEFLKIVKYMKYYEN